MSERADELDERAGGPADHPEPEPERAESAGDAVALAGGPAESAGGAAESAGGADALAGERAESAEKRAESAGGAVALAGAAAEPTGGAVEPVAEPAESAGKPAESAEERAELAYGVVEGVVGPAGRAGLSAERAPLGMRLLGFGLIAGSVAAVAGVVADGAGGDWRTAVVVSGLAVSLLLGGLSMNGWCTRLAGRLLWLFPATLLFMGIVLVADPGYGEFLNGNAERGRGDSGGESVGFAVICLVAGVAGLAGYGFAARNRLFRG